MGTKDLQGSQKHHETRQRIVELRSQQGGWTTPAMIQRLRPREYGQDLTTLYIYNAS